MLLEPLHSELEPKEEQLRQFEALLMSKEDEVGAHTESKRARLC